MCSGGRCDMAGLISGPVGNLVGMGIKALVNGTPIGPRSAEALNKPSEQEKIKQFYDNVESHLKGVLQVLEPAMEIKKLLIGESKSADRERSAITPQAIIQYYSPQNLQKSQDSNCQSRRCALKSSRSHLSTDKSSFKTPSPHSCKKENTTEKKSTQLKPLSSSKSSSKSTKDAPKKRHPSTTSEASSKSCCKSDTKESSKVSVKESKSKQRPKACCMCDVSLKENIILASLPCKHLFCYTCLAVGDCNSCRKCDKPYDMKTVGQIFR